MTGVSQFQRPNEVLTERVPPQNLDMERAIIGAILLDNEALPKALEILSGPNDFYKPGHRKIFQIITDLFEKNEPVDILTLTEAMRTRGWLEEIGGVDYLAELLEIVPTSANIRIHCQRIRDKAILRKIITTASDTVAVAYEQADDVDIVVDNIEKMILDISQERNRGTFVQVKDLLQDTMKTVETLYENKALVTGVPTGYKDLDEKTAGLQKSELIVVAGRPSMGKTAFALNIIQNYEIGRAHV